jgi:hypothetical protein
MDNPKFADLPKDEQLLKQRLYELKLEWAALVERGAPIHEVEAILSEMQRIKIFRQHLGTLNNPIDKL